MPVRRRKDGKGPYYQYGNSGKKYRYSPGNPQSRGAAKSRANQQAKAVKTRQKRGRRRRR